MSKILSELYIGDKVKFGTYQVESETPEPIIWRVAAKDHTGYPANSVTLITDKIIDLRAVDGRELSNPDTLIYMAGSNAYTASNIDQWLNKDSAAGEWYTATHEFDTAPSSSTIVGGYATPYSQKSGFLNLFTHLEKAILLDTTIRIANPTVFGGGFTDFTRKVFLPSKTEVGQGAENGINEGAVWAIFSGGTGRISALTSQAYNNTICPEKPSAETYPWYWWLRTANTSDHMTRGIDPNGAITAVIPCLGKIGIRPACNISKLISVSDTLDEDGCYQLLLWQPPNLSVKVGGEYKAYADGFVKVAGVWKRIDEIHVKIDGVWKRG
jgi:hypothetical protein